MNGDGSADRSRDGFALVAVLAFLAVATAIAAPTFVNANSYALIARNVAQSDRDKVLVRSLIELSAQRFAEVAQLSAETPKWVACDELAPDLGLSISFANHAGLVDLNAASNDLLRAGFAAVGVDSAYSTALANAVEQYRAIDTTGASAPAIKVIGGAKHGLFENVAELIDFELPPDITMDQLGEVFTVQSRSGTVDPDAASARLLAAIEGGPSSPPYLVPDGGRIPAVTVGVELTVARVSVTAHRDFVILQAPSAAGIGPLTVERRAEQPPAAKPPGMACSSFFDATTMVLIRELLG